MGAEMDSMRVDQWVDPETFAPHHGCSPQNLKIPVDVIAQIVTSSALGAETDNTRLDAQTMRGSNYCPFFYPCPLAFFQNSGYPIPDCLCPPPLMNVAEGLKSAENLMSPPHFPFIWVI